ncbi:hypothetical protein J3Q64DRAFT_1705481 [Phycomyces blakesleeanus]|uniref:Uncharacterized protein n=2 Tax=Phycomyces blakesleeanus TaxID=4837 RepID=A0A167PIE3_PHYB8|nr:hypothetical protein PHYBLDRAFT_141848 [Phycomyces blakesleeanus NRRL 1555(-)]OAD77989.1 hypothetical protein PHYBLDRAFT_141848 [Phycomyces blakesleeanus NRRL 1555(-)]|eukprot:XP_018296029.1 hypothetical protein PHYBLDRAFT_141848 [Phycomyces blakesleeanus NRRL 1555(-)]
MDSLHHRLHASPHSDDEAEYLDEQEQEKLLQELWIQNEKSNLFIQRGLILIGFLVSTIYVAFSFEILYSQSGLPLIPIPTSIPQTSTIFFPRAAAVLSILSLYASIYTLLTTCRLSVLEALWKTPAHRGLGSLDLKGAAVTSALALTSPLLALLGQTSWVELGFWTIPLLVLLLDFSAYHMMCQVEANFGDLEKARYKFKAV